MSGWLWTAEEDALLRDNAHLGHKACAAACAAATGRSPEAVRTRARDLQVSLKKRSCTYHDEARERWRREVLPGMVLRLRAEIAEIVR